MPIEIEYYGNATGGETHTVTLNCGALKAVFCDHGARLLELWVPDRNGDLADVVLANGNIEALEAGNAYFGATCGRFANRIKGGRFTLDGQRYQVGLNNGPNHLHGGPIGFDKHVWRIAVDETNNAVRFSMVSPDGDQGHPAGREGAEYGLDRNWVVRGEPETMRHAATAVDEFSGRRLDVSTIAPGVHVYTAGGLSEADVGKGNAGYCRFAGYCFETQHFPDSPNQPHFPSARLDPGEVYDHRMKIEFSIG